MISHVINLFVWKRFAESGRIKKPPLSSSLLDGGNASNLFDSAVKKTPLPSRIYTEPASISRNTDIASHETQTLPTFNNDPTLQSLYGAPMLEQSSAFPAPDNLVSLSYLSSPSLSSPRFFLFLVVGGIVEYLDFSTWIQSYHYRHRWNLEIIPSIRRSGTILCE